jgi:DNA-binding NtrC family response regulator
MQATLPGTLHIPRFSPHMPVNWLAVLVTAGPDAGAATSAVSESVTVGTATSNDLVLNDATVSRYHVELIAHADGVLVIDHGSTNGTWLGSARIERGVVPIGTELKIGHTTLKIDTTTAGLASLHPEDRLGDVCGRAPQMRRVMAKIAKLAQSDAGVLLVGESGTGKELIARALHEQGARQAQPFVTVDCGALAPGLVASELFGHERGAFTSADRRYAGAFERADGGTVFLDEVGELSSELQTHLLGILERRKVRRVGGSEEISVDVRVISATHRDLRAAVNAGRFRLDLYYRLAVVCVDIPPLRQRVEDVPLLVEQFLRECGHEGPVDQVFPPELMLQLAQHSWPGNVRELRNVVEATLATGEMPLGEAPPSNRAPPATVSTGNAADLDKPYKDARAALLEHFERQYLIRLMDRTENNVSRAAREARMTRSHLFELLRRHGQR